MGQTDFDAFRVWLQEERGYTKRTSSDAASRCRRVAECLQCPLDAEDILERVSLERGQILKPGTNPFTIGAYRLAVKRYGEFLRAAK